MKVLIIAGRLIFIFFFAFNLQIFSQIGKGEEILPESRSKISFNEGWKFFNENLPGSESVGVDESKWTSVNLPHTWNAADAFDDVPGYRQGLSWYRKKFKAAEKSGGKRLFIYFEGVNQIADVFVNGKFVGSHVGGYAAFAFDITDFVVSDASGLENVVAVRVNNLPTDDAPPSPTADFNFYGGIYRDVYLIAADPVHLAVNDYASSGVYIDTPQVSKETAAVHFRGKISNDSGEKRKVTVKNIVFDRENKKIAETESLVETEAGKGASFDQTIREIKQPNLWSPNSPYLYSVSTEIYDENNRLIDAVKNPLGFRWFNFDPEKGFSLNGESLKLVGGNRHQDYQGLGNALPKDLHVKDLEIIKKTGMNWILLAHYPHDPAVLEAADRLGLIVWEEIPILRQIGTSPVYAKISEQMLVEMIRQHYNHPSVVFWCYMNEIFLRMKTEKDYVQKTAELARTLEATAKREDPNRLTAISFNRPYTDKDLYEESGLTQIPDVVAWHLYFGWYYGKPEDLGGFLDDYHRRYPQRRLLVSEYGADGNSRIHAVNPKAKDYSTEWSQVLHESYVEQMSSRTFLGGFAVWNTFDFGSESRGESVPHINQKGIYQFNREPKDIAFFYQAKFSAAPVLHIAAREWSKRGETSNVFDPAKGEKDEATQPIKVYTNLPEVELLLNGKSLGKKTVGDSRTVVWNVNLQKGANSIEVNGRDGEQSFNDKAQIEFVVHRKNTKSAQLAVEELAVDVGGEAEFLDETGTLWEADREYQSGNGWGYVDTGAKQDQKTDRNILQTADDPLYQSYRQGFSAYRFDVADGEYQIDLCFADPSVFKIGERVFNISANGVKLLENFDLSKDAGRLTAVIKTFKIRASGGKGLSLDFQPVKGETILNGIRLRRLK